MGARAYVCGVIATGFVTVAAVLASADAVSVRGYDWHVIAILLVGLVLTELRPVSWLRGDGEVRVTASWVFAIGLLLSGGYTTAIVALALCSMASDFTERLDWLRASFNAAQSAVSVALAAMVIALLAPDTYTALAGQLPIRPAGVATIAAASASAYLLNSVLTGIAVALAARLPVIGTLRRSVGLNLSTDGVLLALAPIVVIVAQRSLLLLPLAGIVIAAVYSHARAALLRDREARHDALTGLPNRRQYLEVLTETLASAERGQRRFAVALVDLTGFKQVNDQFGHAAGDQVLRAVANRLAQTASDNELVARLGGDEFALVFDQPGSGSELATRIEDFVLALRPPISVDGIPLTVGGNFGIATYPEDGTSVESILERADTAMYTAKYDGIPVYVSRAHNDRRVHGRNRMQLDMARAIEHDELIVHYQPISTIRGELVGAEALVRWMHPEHGLLPPAEFVPFVENTELMVRLTRHVLDRAIATAASWRDHGRPLEVSVNVSAQDFRDVTFPSAVAEALRAYGLPPALLAIELTEGALANDVGYNAPQTAAELVDLGLKLLLDDFGTGYATLSVLRDLPFHGLKIDRSFVMHSTSERESEIIVSTVIDLARRLGLSVTAEGVEDFHTWRALRDAGCDRIQGWVVSRAIPGPEILQLPQFAGPKLEHRS